MSVPFLEVADRDPSPTVTNATVPTRSLVDGLDRAAKVAGYRSGLMPWQKYAGRVMTGLAGERWVYPEVAVVVARQNGKTSMIVPRVVVGLLRGERIAHAAHNRDLPRESFLEVAGLFESTPALSRYLAGSPRRANGQESIRTVTGGRYRVFSSQTEAIRGTTNDLVIVDEARELVDRDFMAAARPTTLTSPNPQTLYLSNAGHAGSVVLNGLRARAVADLEASDLEASRLAYLEWSAPAEASLDDVAGWTAANPALGHTIDLDRLREFRGSMTAGQFNTECLCRWVTSDRPRLVAADAWDRCRTDDVGDVGTRPVIGCGVDPVTGRVAAVLAWVTDHGRVALELVADVHDPTDLADVADRIADRARSVGVTAAGFDPWTGGDLIRNMRGRVPARPIVGRDLAGAAVLFHGAAESGRLTYAASDTLDLDVSYLERRTRPDGSYVPARGDYPAPAGFAAVYAVWLATTPTAAPSIA